jgi:hypothetical protein
MASLHYTFECRCTRPILVEADKLEDVIAPIPLRTARIDVVGIVCANCKRVRTYSLDENPHPPAIVDKRSPTYMFAGWLGCDDGGCKTKLPLFSLTAIPADPKGKNTELASWRWEEALRCPDGHSIKTPPKTVRSL